MLQNIRERAQGWLAWLILIIVCVPFALWGVYNYFEGGSKVNVAEVNGRAIDIQHFQEAFDNYKRQLEQSLGKKFDVNKLDQHKLKEQALEQLIDGILLQQAADDAHMRISDAQVVGAVRSFAAFQKDGQFERKLYEERLAGAGMNPVAFEEKLRTDMLDGQVQQGIADTAFVTPDEVNAMSVLKEQKRDIVYTTISAQPYRKAVKLTDADIENYYKTHQKEFRIPEMVKIAYLELSVAELAKQIKPTEKELHDYYDQHKNKYQVAEQRSSDYILVHVPKNASKKQDEAAHDEAETLLKRIRAGETFAEVAKSAATSKDAQQIEANQLGFLSKGVMGDAFDHALFSLKQGQVSDVVRTKDGYIIIKLKDIKAGTVKSFAQVKDEVEQAYRKGQAERKYFDKADQLGNLVFENPDSLKTASEKLGLPIKHSDYFTKSGGQGITANPKVLDAAFGPDVLEQGQNSEPLDLGNNRTVVIRDADHRPPTTRSLADVRAQIKDELTAQTAAEEARKQGQQILKRLRGGEDRAKVGTEENVQWQEAKAAGRNDPEVNLAALRAAFKLGAPKNGKPIYGGVALGTGDYAVVGVLSVDNPKEASLDKKVVERTRAELAQNRAIDEWRDFVTALRAQAKIKIYKNNL